VDQTLLTAAILNLAIQARNGMPNGGTHEVRRLENTRDQLMVNGLAADQLQIEYALVRMAGRASPNGFLGVRRQDWPNFCSRTSSVWEAQDAFPKQSVNPAVLHRPGW
jgi:hypothetical protein